MDEGEIGISPFEQLSGRDASLPLANPIQIGSGFTPEDADSPVIVLANSSEVTIAELEVGDKLTYTFG